MTAFDHKLFLSRLSSKPGVYQMLDAKGKMLYVGKAKNLKNRVSSYFRSQQQSVKTVSLVKQIADIKVIVVNSEQEALILENNLIKKFRPRYNVLFRDDKSYPYIYLSNQQLYPRFEFYRGSTKRAGKFFGPYPSVVAVHETLKLIQKVFKIRSCRDSFFQHRVRPCLQYQIQRCSAPCVQLISQADYQRDVEHAVLLLSGKGQVIIDDLQAKMQQASDQQAYELAVKYRNQIASLRHLQASQHMSTNLGDVDVVAVMMQGETACVQLLMVRSGQVQAKQSYFPAISSGTSGDEVLSSFLSFYYLNDQHALPKEILVSQPLSEQAELIESLSAVAGRSLSLQHSQRGAKAGLLKVALLNAQEAINSRLTARSLIQTQLASIQTLLKLPVLPQHIECFDISHTQGEQTVAACVVFGAQGDRRSDYRRFNIRNITAGDDVAAIYQAVLRRYQKLKLEEKSLPELLIIDGGKPQRNAALKALEELQIDDMAILAIAKGRTRKAGFESLFLADHPKPLAFDPDDEGMHLLQHVRDEAHRFAITGHRQQRDKKRQRSLLEDIPGIGQKKRQALLRHFGGLQAVQQAGVDDLKKVPGISHHLAEEIYQRLHA